MKTKFIEYLVIGLTLGVSAAFAQTSAYEQLLPGSCSNMSKNPKCWEGRDNTHYPRSYCERKTGQSCAIVSSVHSDGSGRYYCKDYTKGAFDCNTLVQEFGLNLKGLVVKVIVPYVDACHIPGGCGPKACMPGFGTASLNEACE